MLSPLAIREALDIILHSDTSVADVALVVLSDSGAIYAQTRKSFDEERNVTPQRQRRPPMTEVQKIQLRHQPGLTCLMAHDDSRIERRHATQRDASVDEESMAIDLIPDERARVLAGVACRSWTEEMARIKRLRTNVHGQYPAAMSGVASSVGRSLSGSSNNVGTLQPLGQSRRSNAQEEARDEPIAHASLSTELQAEVEDRKGTEPEEKIGAPVAILGTKLPISDEGKEGGIAPLMLEGELGAVLVMPLPVQSIQAASSAASLGLTAGTPLLLVLSTNPAQSHAKPESRKEISSDLMLASSILSQDQWNEMHDCAQSFASYVAPALRKAFGGMDLHRDPQLGVVPSTTAGGANGISLHGTGRKSRGGNTVFSDDRESSASIAGLNDQRLSP